LQQLAERNKKSTLQTTKLCAKLDEKKEQLHIDITASKDMESVVGHAIIGTNYKGLICINTWHGHKYFMFWPGEAIGTAFFVYCRKDWSERLA
jgi:hypothetical protein